MDRMRSIKNNTRSSGLLACTLVGSFGLACLFGAQAASWSWGPSLIGLGMAVAAGLLVRPSVGVSRWCWITGFLTVVWILWRAYTSEVVDFARSDSLLVLALISVWWTVVTVGAYKPASRTLFVGLGLVLWANVLVALVQWKNPGFAWPYGSRPVSEPTGFFGQYNYFANFIVALSIVSLSRACFAKDSSLVRWFHALTFLLGVVGVWLSGSRGGALALGGGILFFVLSSAIIGWRNRSRFAPLILIALPGCLVGLLVGGWIFLRGILDRRNLEGAALDMADNSSRLEWIQLAFTCIGEHPFVGGGARSFSWEKNSVWDLEVLQPNGHSEPFVHNEALQLLTDYGWVGFGLIFFVMCAAFWHSLRQIFLGSSSDRQTDADSMAVGALAAGAAVLLQSNLSFVFHLLPGVMILGLILGMAVLSADRQPRVGGTKVPRVGVGSVLCVCCLYFGFRGSQALRYSWPMLYGKLGEDRLPAVEADWRFEQASRLWPGYAFLEYRGNHANAVASTGDVESWLKQAILSYETALTQHPYHPGMAVNLANSLGVLGRNEEAERWFRKAIELQGGLEGAYKARFCYARFLYTLWYDRWTNERRSSEALGEFRQALRLLDEAESSGGWWIKRDVVSLREEVQRSVDFLEGAGIGAEPVIEDAD